MFFFRFGGDLLSHDWCRSTIGAVALNGRVRDGIGCFAHAMTTKPEKEQRPPCCGEVSAAGYLPAARYTSVFSNLCLRSELCRSGFAIDWRPLFRRRNGLLSQPVTGSDQVYRAISTGQLNALLRLHLRPIDVVVFHGPQGDLVLRGASRLDAFSGYPVRS